MREQEPLLQRTRPAGKRESRQQLVMRIADADAEEEGERSRAARHLHMLPVITVEARGVYFYPPLACVCEAFSCSCMRP